jgi:hypothetical protein
METTTTEHTAQDDSQADCLEIVRKNVAHLRFGSVQITVRDGRVTQVESVEKTRIAAPRDTRPNNNH